MSRFVAVKSTPPLGASAAAWESLLPNVEAHGAADNPMAAAMLVPLVTSSGRMRSRGESGSKSLRGVRMVAMTCQSRCRKYEAISRPKPDEQPVMRTVFMLDSL